MLEQAMTTRRVVPRRRNRPVLPTGHGRLLWQRYAGRAYPDCPECPSCRGRCHGRQGRV